MLSPYKMLKTALTTIVLHKMIREEPKEFCTPEGFIDDDDDDGEIIQISWRDDGIGDFLTSSAEMKITICNYSAK